jgi:hypothetical protein
VSTKTSQHQIRYSLFKPPAGRSYDARSAVFAERTRDRRGRCLPNDHDCHKYSSEGTREHLVPPACQANRLKFTRRQLTPAYDRQFLFPLSCIRLLDSFRPWLPLCSRDRQGIRTSPLSSSCRRRALRSLSERQVAHGDNLAALPIPPQPATVLKGLSLRFDSIALGMLTH